VATSARRFPKAIVRGYGGLSLGQVVTSPGATNGEFWLTQVGCACAGNCVMGTPHPILSPFQLARFPSVDSEIMYPMWTGEEMWVVYSKRLKPN